MCGRRHCDCLQLFHELIPYDTRTHSQEVQGVLILRQHVLNPGRSGCGGSFFRTGQEPETSRVQTVRRFSPTYTLRPFSFSSQIKLLTEFFNYAIILMWLRKLFLWCGYEFKAIYRQSCRRSESVQTSRDSCSPKGLGFS